VALVIIAAKLPMVGKPEVIRAPPSRGIVSIGEKSPFRSLTPLLVESLARNVVPT